MQVLGRRAALALEQSREGLCPGDNNALDLSSSGQACPPTIKDDRAIDRDHPPDPTYISKLPRAAGENEGALPRGRTSHDSLSPLQHSEKESDRDSGWAGEGQVSCVRSQR